MSSCRSPRTLLSRSFLAHLFHCSHTHVAFPTTKDRSRPGTRNSFSYGIKTTLSSLLFLWLNKTSKNALVRPPNKSPNESPNKYISIYPAETPDQCSINSPYKDESKPPSSLYYSRLLRLLQNHIHLLVQLRDRKVPLILDDSSVLYNSSVLRDPFRNNIRVRAICAPFEL